MPDKNRVLLSSEERTALIERISSGTAPACTVTRARLLLKADESTDGHAWTDQRIADALLRPLPKIVTVYEPDLSKWIDFKTRKPR